MRRHELRLGEASVTVREWGGGNLPAVVYWHGLNPFGALELNEAGPAWAKRGVRVLAVAAPGVADSRPLPDWDAYRPSRLADLVVEVAAASRVKGRFVYIGWSWGASIGVHLAVRHAERLRALALLDAGHTDIPGDPTRDLEGVLAEVATRPERYRYPDWASFLAAAREQYPHWRPALERRLIAGMREADGAVIARADRNAVAAAGHGLRREPPSSTHRVLEQLNVPILLLAASHGETEADLARFRSTVPAAEVQTIESRHDLLADAPDETIKRVGDWIAQHRR